MKTLIPLGLLLAAAAVSALPARAQESPTTPPVTSTAPVAHTAGYDRPAPTNHQADGHQHVVYWSDFFDRFTFDPQVAADANSYRDIKDKPKRK